METGYNLDLYSQIDIFCRIIMKNKILNELFTRAPSLGLKDYYIPKYERKKLLFSYPEFENKNLTLKTYLLESILCDKIGRILDILDIDNGPRDLYDLWYLLKLNLDIKITKKEFKNKYSYEILISDLLREIAKDDYSRNWKNRLIYQIVDLLDYKMLIEDLNRLIKEKFE